MRNLTLSGGFGLENPSPYPLPTLSLFGKRRGVLVAGWSVVDELRAGWSLGVPFDEESDFVRRV